jgi:hypothetical protein
VRAPRRHLRRQARRVRHRSGVSTQRANQTHH